MDNIGMDENIHNIKENTHKSRCTECPSYNECMGSWLNYFAGKIK